MAADVSTQLRQARRSALVLALLALGLPAGCHTLFERQARRFDAVVHHGAQVDATVSRVDAHGGYIVYTVAGQELTSSVGPDDAHGIVPGQTLSLTVLPEAPTLFVVGTRSRATEKASKSRAFAIQVDLGLVWFFGFAAAMSAWQYQRMKRTGRTEAIDRGAYRARLMLCGIWIAPLFTMIFALHWLDGRARGESAWPIVLSIGACLRHRLRRRLVCDA